MSLSDYLLSTLGVYGLPVLFGALLLGSMGIPLPASLLLLAAGSFIEQGVLDMWPVLGLSVTAAIIGDNVGYTLGRWGGRRMHRRIDSWVGGEHLGQADSWLKRREGAAIFFSRWLLTPLGPIINITAGLREYSWPRFLFYVVTGEALWVTLYVMLGRVFSDRVQVMSDFLGDFIWMILGLILVLILGWKFFQYSSSGKPDLRDSRALPDNNPEGI